MVRDKGKTQLPLTQLSLLEARETLGVWIAADGNWRTQTRKLKDKATTWGDKLAKGYLREADTTVALQTTITKSLAYALPATSLTKTQCKDIMSPLLLRTLPKL